MANLAYNFNKIQRTFFNVELKDGRKLHVRMPKKSTFSKLSVLQDMTTDQNITIDDVIDTLSALVAECLSNNMENERVEASYVAEEYDIEEMRDFMNAYYTNFIGSIEHEKN